MDVFDFAERKALESNPDLSLYRSLTSDQVIGLLDACGNYFARRPELGPEELPFTARHGSDVVAAHRDLVHAYHRVAVDGEASLPHEGATFVFSEAEQQSLRLHKYIRGCERITHNQLLDLLTAVHAYSAVGTDIPLRPEGGIVTMMNRYFHAHNSLIRFGREPFTDAEFVEDLHETVLMRR